MLYAVLFRPLAAPAPPVPTEVSVRRMTLDIATARDWLAVAVEEARLGLAEGGIPIGGALVAADGTVLGRGHNRRVQDDDPSMHGETSAFRNAGRQRTYAGTTMVTTLSPCWYCSGLVRQFGISRVVVGEATDVLRRPRVARRERRRGGRARGPDCIGLMEYFIADRPDLWFEDIGVDPA